MISREVVHTRGIVRGKGGGSGCGRPAVIRSMRLAFFTKERIPKLRTLLKLSPEP